MPYSLPYFYRSWCCLVLLCAAQLLGARTTLYFKNTQYQSLDHTAARLGMQYAWSTPEKRILLTSQWTRLEFERHKRYFRLDGIKVHLGHAIILQRRDLYLSQGDYKHALAPILTPQVFQQVPKLYHIVLDPGHGGRDPGCVVRNTYEKALTLDLARRLQAVLRERGYRVSLTRDKDTRVSLTGRSALANRLGADLFISLHFNASRNTTARGIETYAYTPRYQPSSGRSKQVPADRLYRPGNQHDPWNALLSFYLQRELLRYTGAPDRGSKRARFAVLQALKCPGVLVEGGFLSQPKEGAALRTAAYRKTLARAIAQGISRYQKTLNRLHKDERVLTVQK